MHSLIPHPGASPHSVERVTANLSASGSGGLWLEYSVSPTHTLVLPAGKPAARADGLWRSTCFELFVQPAASDRYFEFNFSPSSEWAAYEFDSYRSGMRDWPTHDPEIVLGSGETHFFLALEALPQFPATALRIGLSAVIEEADGTKSYWALAHPPGAPDFHHPDGFALELPPVT